MTHSTRSICFTAFAGLLMVMSNVNAQEIVTRESASAVNVIHINPVAAEAHVGTLTEAIVATMDVALPTMPAKDDDVYQWAQASADQADVTAEALQLQIQLDDCTIQCYEDYVFCMDDLGREDLCGRSYQICISECP